jgi:paraquat-inducible protein B
MEQLIAQTPSVAAAQINGGLPELQRQELATQKSLDETNKKLDEARLGEKLERDQKSERLQVIEQPVQPQKPIKPNKPKLLALSLALAMAAGAGAIFARETLDKSIRSSRELLAVAHGRLIVSIPYIATHAETVRRRSRFWLSSGIVLTLAVAGVVGFVFFGPPIDPSWINQLSLDRLTGLTK